MNQEIIKAVVKAQVEIKPPVKDQKMSARGGKEYRYASLDSIYEAVRETLAQNGLSLSHSVSCVGETYFLITTLRHISGESIDNHIPMFVGGSDPQSFGTALTYARRYAVCSLLALPTEDDIDGIISPQEVVQKPMKEKPNDDSSTLGSAYVNSAERQKKYTVSDAQLKYLEDLGSKNPITKNSIFSHHNISSFQELNSININKVMVDQMIEFLKVGAKTK